MSAPTHVCAYLSTGVFGWRLDGREADPNLQVRFHGLPVGLQSSFTFDEPELLEELGSELHEWPAVLGLIRRMDDRIQRYPLKSDKVNSRELRLWAEINDDQLHDRWLRYDIWRLRRLVADSQDELEQREAELIERTSL